jgi:stress-induced-phosphoprotein 1
VSEAADRVCKVLTRKGRMLEKKALKGPRPERARGLREALKCLQEAQKQQPEDTSEQQRGVLGKSIEAVQVRLTALQLDDEAKEELANGDRMFADGQHAAAIKFYDKAERADPRGERADAYLMYSNRAGCLLELKRLRQALRDAERCIELKPSWPTGHMLKGRVHEALEEWGQMLAACGKAYDLDPDNETNLAMLRDCLVQHLTDDSLRRQPGALSEVIGRAREDEKLRRLVQDPQVVQVTSEMRRTRDLSPLVKVLEDLPLAGKLAKLFEVGMLVPGM